MWSIIHAFVPTYLMHKEIHKLLTTTNLENNMVRAYFIAHNVTQVPRLVQRRTDGLQ
jgi:hypothetical protein